MGEVVPHYGFDLYFPDDCILKIISRLYFCGHF